MEEERKEKRRRKRKEKQKEVRSLVCEAPAIVFCFLEYTQSFMIMCYLEYENIKP